MKEIDGNDGHLLLTTARVIQFLFFFLAMLLQTNNLIINPEVLFCVGLSGYHLNEDAEL